jgi:hypothetical protein
MRVVSETPDEEIAARKAEEAANQAREQVRRALHTLAASLLRTMRGAGDPENLELHAAAFLAAAEEYRSIAGHGVPVGEVRADLSIVDENAESGISAARESILSGSLGIAAARLLGELTQERLGSNDLSKGLLAWKQAVQKSQAGER